MFKLIRAFAVSAVIAVSLLGTASFASADSGQGQQGQGPSKSPPARHFDITWE